MNEYRRIYIPLSREEFIALSESARCDYRHPRDQARFIIRAALGGDSPPNAKQKKTTSAKLETANAGGVSITQ